MMKSHYRGARRYFGCAVVNRAACVKREPARLEIHFICRACDFSSIPAPFHYFGLRQSARQNIILFTTANKIVSLTSFQLIRTRSHASYPRLSPIILRFREPFNVISDRIENCSRSNFSIRILLEKCRYLSRYRSRDLIISKRKHRGESLNTLGYPFNLNFPREILV